MRLITKIKTDTDLTRESPPGQADTDEACGDVLLK